MAFFKQIKRFILVLNTRMKRYLTLLLLFINLIAFSQNPKSISITLVDKIDIGSSFEVTDNNVGNAIKSKLENKGFNFSDTESKYFISVSFGWKYKRSTELEIDNFQGSIFEKINSDKIIAQFSLSKIKDLDKAIDSFIDELIYRNNQISTTGKFIDVQDHFMKMNMKSWDFSRSDAHAPSGVLADHVHSRGGIMLGYRHFFSKGEGNYNGDQIYNRDEITKYYDRHVTQNIFSTHSIEFMYGITNKITLFTNFNFHKKQYSFINKQNISYNSSSSGIGDIDLQFLYSLFSNSKIKVHSNIGFILPAGTINKKNENQISPYSMQLGNGYFSSVIGFTAFFQFKKFSAGIQPIYNLPFSNNSRGYNNGNRLGLNYWGAVNFNKPFSFSFRQHYINQKSINGIDNELVTNLMILNNSNNSGYILLNSALGMNLSFKKGLLRNSRISLEYFFPTYMSYEGLQVGSFNGFVLNLQYSPGGHKNH